uniref:Uncharacterized protein n=1 Tax=Setaria italica TaxID=4555 RepID=K4AP09_SETIT
MCSVHYCTYAVEYDLWSSHHSMILFRSLLLVLVVGSSLVRCELTVSLLLHLVLFYISTDLYFLLP